MKRIRRKTKPSKNYMGILEHLNEFRKRLAWVIAIVFLMILVSYQFAGSLVRFGIQKAESLNYTLVYLAPGELFAQYIKISLIMGIVLASPFILFQIWAFVRPGLKRGERISVFFSLFAGLFCFLAGAVFSYQVAIPMILQFFSTVDQNQFVTPTISIQNYMSFILTSLLTFGLVFEMPVITVLLSQLGVLKAEWLVRSRKLVIVAIFLIGAIITPPDVISQMVVALPMLLLFEISVLLSKLVGRIKQKKEDALFSE